MSDTKWLDNLEEKTPSGASGVHVGALMQSAPRLIAIARESAEKDAKIARLERIEAAAVEMAECAADDCEWHHPRAICQEGLMERCMCATCRDKRRTAALAAYRKATEEQK